jgi:hypothetical protein
MDSERKKHKSENIEDRIVDDEIPIIAFNFNRLYYDSFLNLVLRGQIRGKDLIYFCNTSKRFREYGDKNFI